MSFVIHPPVALFVVLGAVTLALVLAVKLKRMQWWRTLLGVVVAIAACGTLLFLVLGAMRIVVDDAGIHGLNGRQSIPWSSVSRAVLVENLASSPWDPVMKTGGTSLGAFKSGRFRIANGSVAFLQTETAGRALVILGDGKTLVLAPRALDELVSEVAKHVPVERGGGLS